MLRSTIPICIAFLLNTFPIKAQLIDNFDDNTLTNWFNQSCYTLAETNQELNITATNAFNYQVFHKQNLTENFVANKILYFKFKTSTAVTLRVDLGDATAKTTNAAAISFAPTADGAYHVYQLDFNNRFRQSFPSASLVDSTAITQVIFFLNAAGPAFSGNVFIDSLGHRPDLIALPVHFASFGGTVLQNKILLNFSVAEESDVKKYIVQKSTDNGQWFSIQEIMPKNNNGNASYTLTDNTIWEGNNLYRIMIENMSGNTLHSTIWKYNYVVKRTKTQLVQLSKGVFQLRFNNVINDPAIAVNTYTLSGQLLKQINLATGQQSIDMAMPVNGFAVLQYKSAKRELYKLIF